MKESKEQRNSLYERVPAMAAINKVPGFDPRKFLRMVVKENGEKAWKLDLGYMRAWFRMSRPNGRLRFKPLRITEQLAIFEAQVFLDRNDVEPFSNFTAQCTQEEAENGDYIKAAQDAALTVALTDAGFGIQFVDLIHDEKGENYGSEVPVSGQLEVKEVLKQNRTGDVPVSSAAEHTSVKHDAAADTLMEHAAAKRRPVLSVVPEQTDMVTNFSKKENQVEQLSVQEKSQLEESLPVQAAEGNLATQITGKISDEHLPVQSTVQVAGNSPAQISAQAVDKGLPVQASAQAAGENLPVKASAQGVNESLPVQASAQAVGESLPVQVSTPVINESLPVKATAQAAGESLPVSQNQVSYTADMPVEEILKQMTFEEAQKVVVDMGVCNGWTMAEVAERRAPSLKFYVYGGYRGNNNILRAAAKIMLDSLTEQKAS